MNCSLKYNIISRPCENNIAIVKQNYIGGMCMFGSKRKKEEQIKNIFDHIVQIGKFMLDF